MNLFKKLNNIVGWIVFAIATTVYFMTMEPTASFWDCGEFILTSYKLEVGHPPGAPFFLLLGRLFSMFANDTSHVAIMVNAMSALASAFTILFLFWTITHFARKIVGDPQTWDKSQLIAVLGSGLVGALAYTFSDTFWFSAVEGEVYGMSSMLTAIVFWAILKWEDCSDDNYANRWIVFIALIMGISIGVHLLNLLAIPAIGLVYYYKKNLNPSTKGAIKAFLVSCVILGIIIWGIIPGTFVIASKFELLFVNGFGLPYNTGAYFWFILLISAVVFSIYYTYKVKKHPLWNTIFICVAMILLGYSSYAMIVIRSSANTPMDQNNPNDPFSIVYYLNREQYGDRPLLYGQYYNAPATSTKDGKAVYAKKNGKYEIITYNPQYEYDSRFMTIFPRMYDNRTPSHVRPYETWGNVSTTRRPVKVADDNGSSSNLIVPSFAENLRFFFTYQLNFMYFRYFMWNFAGRQNDLQGLGGPLQGNWLSGIKFIDEMRLGPQDYLPDAMKNNPGRNTYFMLPFLFGLLGLLWHYGRNKGDFWVVFLLFFMTGIAIVLYLNQTPLQPRERDYAYAGSFYAFSIWVGLGLMAIFETISKKYQNVVTASAVVVISLLAVPTLMAKENWDDHDRSGRYLARDIGYNYLQSCAPNAIIFTNGDNDTFPLWYNQEVEGVRTDVRVMNLSYLSADWYINQMLRKSYESEPFISSMTPEQYESGNRDVMYVLDRMTGNQELKDVMQFLASDDDRTKRIPGVADPLPHIPSSNLKITVDSTAVIKTGTVPLEDADKIEKEINWTIPKSSLFQEMVLFKNGMMTLDFLANNLWDRPVYFAITVDNDNYLGLEKYFRLDGFAYKLVPIKGDFPNDEFSSINTDILYENYMHKFRWGNIEDPKVYTDEQMRRMLGNYRTLFGYLAKALILEDKQDKAIEVLDRALYLIPNQRTTYTYNVVPLIEGYYNAGAKDKAFALMDEVFDTTLQELIYYFHFDARMIQLVENELRLALYTVSEMGDLAAKYEYPELEDKVDKVMDDWTMKLGYSE